jgi:hypothetical protein
MVLSVNGTSLTGMVSLAMGSINYLKRALKKFWLPR